jgi:hypothetical protein
MTALPPGPGDEAVVVSCSSIERKICLDYQGGAHSKYIRHNDP